MGGELLGVRRRDIEDRFADSEHCAICGTDEEKLLEAAVIGEDECVWVCKVCLTKHGEEIDEESDEVAPPDESESDSEMDEDMR